MYDAVNDSRTRPQHLEWDGLVLPVDHPFWKTHAPPNGWGCRCMRQGGISRAILALSGTSWHKNRPLDAVVGGRSRKS